MQEYNPTRSPSDRGLVEGALSAAPTCWGTWGRGSVLAGPGELPALAGWTVGRCTVVEFAALSAPSKPIGA